MDNKELLEKAVITAEALASGGKLPPATADKFIQLTFDLTTLKNHIRTVTFKPEEYKIPKIGIGRRVAMPKPASATQVRRGVSTGEIVLHPVEIIVPFEIGDSFLELNIEGENVEDTIVRLMATQLANDLEELYIYGDELGHADWESNLVDDGANDKVIVDSYLKLIDGWLTLSQSGHLVDASWETFSPTLISEMIMAMPNKWKRNRADLRLFVSPELEQVLRDKLGQRATAGGDRALTESEPLKIYGIPVVPVPILGLYPKVVEHVTLSGTDDVSLKFNHILTNSEIVAPSDLGSTPTSPYEKETDYTIDYTAGTIARVDGGGISDGATVKVTYQASPVAILTPNKNFLVGISREVRVEKDRDIYAGTNQFAITCKVDAEIEETDAVVMALNISPALS